MGKTFGHRPQNPTWIEALHTMGCSLDPRGDHLQHCSLYPRAMQPQHYKFHFAWVDHQSPISQRVVATLIRVYPPQLLPPPTWKVGEWICDTLRYVWGVVFMEVFGRLRVVLRLGLRGIRWWEWRKLHELNDLYCSPNIVWVIKLRTLRWVVHVEHMGERISV